MTRARNVLAVILTPKAEKSSEVLCCDTRNDWILRCAQNDENAMQEITGWACPNLFGSVISMQAWMQHSPSKVVFAALRMTEMHNEEARLLQFVEKIVPMWVY